MPERLYLLHMNKGRWANTVRAVRDARGLLYGEENPSITTASDIVTELRDTGEPQLVGENDDLELVQAAAALFADCADVEVNPIIESHENVLDELEDGIVAEDEEGFTASAEGVRLALITLSVAQGNAPAAILIAGVYFTATHDPAWLEARYLIRSTFQSPEQAGLVPAQGGDPGDAA